MQGNGIEPLTSGRMRYRCSTTELSLLVSSDRVKRPSLELELDALTLSYEDMAERRRPIGALDERACPTAAAP